jgi:type IV pilus assembly protein PilM
MNALLARARGLLEGGVQEGRLLPRYPALAVEIAPRRIIGVRFARERKTGADVLKKAQARELPAGAIEPSLTAPNIKDPETVAAALAGVLGALHGGEHRVALLLPDHVARVALLHFPNLPRARRELEELVRFRMAKSLPFKTTEAALDIQVIPARPTAAGTAGATVLSTFVKRAVLQQYESLVSAAGYWPGLVGLSTFELFNLFRGRIGAEVPADRDVMLLNVTPYYAATVILSDGDLIFYRCKPHQESDDEEQRIAALRREAYTSFAFYQEKLLGRGIGQVFLRVVGLPREAVRAAVTSETKCEGRWLDLREAVTLAAESGLDDEEAAWACPASGAAVGRRR